MRCDPGKYFFGGSCVQLREGFRKVQGCFEARCELPLVFDGLGRLGRRWNLAGAPARALGFRPSIKAQKRYIEIPPSPVPGCRFLRKIFWKVLACEKASVAAPRFLPRPKTYFCSCHFVLRLCFFFSL